MDATAPVSIASRRWTLASAVLGSSMAFMDGTVVNVALPAIQRGLGASAADAQWLIEAYALFLAALLLVGGALGDRFGRKRVFLVGVAMFTLMSVACGLAPDTGMLIAARAAQGVGAALLVPGSLALLGANFPAAERGRAIGTWSAFSGITAAIGPVVGGFLVDHVSWRCAFLLNAPVGVVLLLACAARVPESRGDAADAPVDLAGATAATLGLGGVVFALIEAPSHGWAAWPVRGAALAGVAALAGFVAILFALSRRAGSLVDAIGARTPLVAGPAIAAAGFALFALPGVGGSYWTTFFPAICVLALGMAVTIAPLTTTVMNCVGEALAGTASGINNAVSRAAGLLAIAAFGALLAQVFDARLPDALARAGVPREIADAVVAQHAKLAAATAPAGTASDVAARVHAAVGAAFVDGFRVAMLLAAGLALASAASAWFMIPGRRAKPDSPIDKDTPR